MRKKFYLSAILLITAIASEAQDSVMVQIRPKYDRVGKTHRFFFGENYRKEWADSTLLPVIKISEAKGGLKPIRTGGGFQTLSLRLSDKTGKEWVLRSIEKDPSVLLPEGLRETFAKDVLDDAMSAQHPYAPLVVPVIATAAGVPHATPIIGIVASDTALGEFNKIFTGRVCLLEEREPIGSSDNTAEMLAALMQDNDNTYDSKAFLRAQLLDLLIGDWDRHADQWRWHDVQKGKVKVYEAVPRDRDQAFYVNQGLVPKMASRPWLAPNLQGFKGRIPHVRYSLFKTNFAFPSPAYQFSFAEWMRITNDFVKAITDTVIEVALKKLPPNIYKLRHDRLAAALKQRRENIPAAMIEYYRFIKRIPDIHLSDRNELIQITDAPDKALHVAVLKKTRQGSSKDTIMSTVYDPSITKEIRLFTGKGDDSVSIDNRSSHIRLRIIGGEGQHKYHVVNSAGRVKVYDKRNSASFTGNSGALRKHLSNDTSNTRFIATNRYNIPMPVIAAGYNLDDGFIFGLGLQYTHQGFRKVPYAGVNRLTLAHSFSTSAYRIRYSSEWIHVIGKTDLLINGDAFAPNNTQNFFGRGNETGFNKTGDFKKFYRARFSLYQFTTALRWRNAKGSSFSIGPSLQHYDFDSTDNTGRFLTSGVPINSYDSLTYTQKKTHVGLVANYMIDKRNNKIIPFKGYYASLRVQSYWGVGDFSRSFAMILPEIAVYKNITTGGSIIFADRLGAAFTMGKSAFYQSAFIGGHDNLLGYRQYRFAGEHSVYNNAELRIKLARLKGYIIPGQLGLIGFYDIGRVWIKDDNSSKLHWGTGGGLYFAPVQIAVVSAVLGYSDEGVYPYVTLGFRF